MYWLRFDPPVSKRISTMRWDETYHAVIPLRYLLNFRTVKPWIWHNANFILLQSLFSVLFFERKYSGEVFWRKMNGAYLRILGSCPFLASRVHKCDPFSSSFDGFRSCIVEIWNGMQRNSFIVVFHVTAAAHHTSPNHFLPHKPFQSIEAKQRNRGKPRKLRSWYDITTRLSPGLPLRGFWHDRK